MSTVNPAYAIDPNINDESGFTFDIGTRGNVKNFVNYDISGFVINYDNRIGFIQKELEDGNVKAFRTNTGQAIIYGVEGLADINLRDIFY
jgi:Fe(3+) dicitrate transport protein